LQDINALWHNKTMATEYLFKGTKEIAAVGTLVNSDQTEEKKETKGLQEAFSTKQGQFDFTSVF
jgi:hypothetical protein